MKSFKLYLEDKEVVPSRVVLGEDNKLKPFYVSNDRTNEFYGNNMAYTPIMDAFKKGGVWGVSSDKDGKNRPVRIPPKKLYLTGGALRDHLSNKTFNGSPELISNASSDEIEHVLSQNKFRKTHKDDAKNHKYAFYVAKIDEKGCKKPIVYGVVSMGKEFRLSPFIKNYKGMEINNAAFGTHLDDAMSRDFTLNGLSLLLSNPNGPNRDIVDFFGGTRDLVNKDVKSISPFETSMEQDPIRGCRYIRMINRYGNSNNNRNTFPIIKKVIQSKGLDQPRAIDEIDKTLSIKDLDPTRVLRAYQNVGILDNLLPNLNYNFDVNPEVHDPYGTLSLFLMPNSPEKLENCMSNNGWNKKYIDNVTTLVYHIRENKEWGTTGKSLMHFYTTKMFENLLG